MTDYVIVGTGVAGISAAEGIRSVDRGGQITMIGDEPEIYYSRPGLAYVLTGEVPETRLFPYQAADFERLNINLQIDTATRINRAECQVALASGTFYGYDRLLIATGAAARTARTPGADLPGVVKLDNFADAREIIRQSKKARAAVVVGGGITALEIVEGISAHRVKVHYFLRRDRYWGNVLDPKESRIVEERLLEEGVKIHYHTNLAAIIGRPAGMFRRGPVRVSAVRTESGDEIPCEIVAIAIGVVPRTQLAHDAGLETDRGVLVDEFLRTSDPAIYAAGDVAQVYDPILGKSVVDSLWSPARDQGWAAGLNMAGQRTAYQKKSAFNVTRLAGLTTTIIGSVGSGERNRNEDLIGIIRGDSERWRESPEAIALQSGFDVNRIRIVLGDRTLLGGIVMGDQTLSRPLMDLVINEVDITEIRAQLLEPEANATELLLRFWDHKRRRGVRVQNGNS